MSSLRSIVSALAALSVSYTAEASGTVAASKPSLKYSVRPYTSKRELKNFVLFALASNVRCV